MKIGLIIAQGSEKEIRKEFEKIKEKAKEEYPDYFDDRDNAFDIETKGLRVSFYVDELHKNEYAIYQFWH